VTPPGAVIDPRHLFSIVFALVVVERLFELGLSARNRKRALARGGVVVKEDPYGWIVVLHSLFVLMVPLEVWFLPGIASPPLAWSMTVVAALAMGLRYWAILTLGDRWNAQVICVPGLPAVHHGPYRWIRHPNYVALALEMFALPLIGGAWRSALVFGLLNLVVLRFRIKVEEAALSTHSDYAHLFGEQPRFVPGGRRTS
jgi:methyltransferase